MDVLVTACPADNPTNCNTTSGPFGNYYVNNGFITFPLPSDFNPGIFTMKLKPRDSNWQWSNEVKVSVGTTYGLEDSTAYWIMPSTPVTYKGTNYFYNKDFTTVIGYLPQSDMCGDPGKTWYFLKDSPEAYLNPKVPGASWTTNANYLLHVIPWKQKPGWSDEYLYVKGFEEYLTNFQSLSYDENFQQKTWDERFDSADPTKPGYAYTPRWIG